MADTLKASVFKRFRWLGIEQGPPCPRACNTFTVLDAVIDGRDEWRCPVCGARR